MKKQVLAMVAILVVAFALGSFISVISPTEIQAGENECLSFDWCIYQGPPGSGGCPQGITEYWSMTAQYGCCGTLLFSCCYCP